MTGTDMIAIPFPPTPHTAEKRIECGSPVLYLNGKKSAPILYALSDIPASNPLTAQAQRNIAQFAEQGFRLFSTYIPLYKGWRKNRPYNPDFILGELAAILETCPSASILLRLYVNPPYWWMRDNPDELCEYGIVAYEDSGEYERMIIGDEENEMRASLASEKWKHDAGEALVELLNAIINTPQGHHVVGIQIAGGVYGEWHQWGFKYQPDYGKAFVSFFRKYIKEKYNDEATLRRAWNDENASFKTAVPAPPSLRYRENMPVYRDPRTDAYVVDSLTALMRCAPDAIMYFSQIIRKTWKRPLLIGAFYGYYDSWDNSYASGHLDVERLSDSGAVDFYAAPFRYDRVLRSINGVASARGFLESERLNGILWFTEMDNPPIGSAKQVGGDPERRDESIACLRRNVLEPICRGMGVWFFDHRLVLDTGMACTIYLKKGWWDHPALMREAHLLHQISEFCASKPYQPAADVLLVFGIESSYYSVACDAFSRENERGLFMAVGKSGVAYDSIYLHDLEKAEIERYCCVIFVDTVFISNKIRAYIQEHVAKSGRSIVWINACGLISEINAGVQNIVDLNGITLKHSDSCGTVVYREPFASINVSPPVPYSTLFSAEDSYATTVATFADTDETAALVRKTKDYVQWYFSQFPTSSDILRELFRISGAHIYCEQNVALLAGNGLLVVTVDCETDVEIRLRNGCIVSDNLPSMTTAIFDEQSGERLDITFLKK